MTSARGPRSEASSNMSSGGTERASLWHRIRTEIQEAPKALREQADKLARSLADMLKDQFVTVARSVLLGLGAVLAAVAGGVLKILHFVLDNG